MAAVHRQEADAAPGMVHVAIMRTVRPGREHDFEQLIHEFFEQAERQPGVCGAYLIRPFAGAPSREYGVLRSFASAPDRDRFYASELYRRWNEAVGPLVEGPPRRQELHGLEAFFDDGGAQAPRPPRWKMATLTWLGVVPAVYLFSHAVPAAVDLPWWLNLVVVNALVVASLTWVLMPWLTKLFHGWLHRPPP
jgi:uncharacterized protein